MPLSLPRFKALSLIDQLGVLLTEGTHLATRYEEEDMITLYYLGNFFVEVYYDLLINHLHPCRSFTSTEGLADYMSSVQFEDFN